MAFISYEDIVANPEKVYHFLKGNQFAPFIILVDKDGNPISGTSPLDVRIAGASDNQSGALGVLLKAGQVKETTLQTAASAVGNGQILDVVGQATAVFSITGTFVGTISFEGTVNDVDWFPLLTTQFGTGAIGNTATTTGLYRSGVAGLKSVRARISSYTSGSITIIGRATAIDSSNKSVQIYAPDTAPLAIKILESLAQLPTSIENHYQQTTQTHNAVSVGASNSTTGAWIDTNGFDKIAISIVNDAATSSYAYVDWSNDGVTIHGSETNVATGTLTRKSAIVDTKLRYVRIGLVNADTAAHTMSAWAFLKA